MLAYSSYLNLFETFNIITAPGTPRDLMAFTAGMDQDACSFFMRTARDVRVLALAADRHVYIGGTMRRLAAALRAPEAERGASWRRFYHILACLLVRHGARAATGGPACIEARERLSGFLAENADLAGGTSSFAYPETATAGSVR